MADMVRKHFIIPRHLAEEFEREAGARGQSAALAEILNVWLRNRRLADVVERLAGFVSAEDHPEWATPEAVYEWVRAERAQERDPWAIPSKDHAAAGG